MPTYRVTYKGKSKLPPKEFTGSAPALVEYLSNPEASQLQSTVNGKTPFVSFKLDEINAIGNTLIATGQVNETIDAGGNYVWSVAK